MVALVAVTSAVLFGRNPVARAIGNDLDASLVTGNQYLDSQLSVDGFRSRGAVVIVSGTACVEDFHSRVLQEWPDHVTARIELCRYLGRDSGVVQVVSTTRRLQQDGQPSSAEC